MKRQVSAALRSRYEDIARKLTEEAEDSVSVSVYISADDIADAMGDMGYDPKTSPFNPLREWVADRRALGFEPTADEILKWIEDEETPDVLAA